MNHPTVDFYISNPRHHVEMVLPVIRRLVATSKVRCRVISLAGLRGLDAPGHRFEEAGARFLSLVEPRRRHASAGRLAARTSPHGPLRRLARVLAWRRRLRKKVLRTLSDGAGLVVVPNDAAFPYDRIVAEVRRHGTPSLLLQEGIRFPLPAASDHDRYGLGGTSAIACWGESSARYFLDLGIAPDRLHLTGSPRFDDIDSAAAATLPGDLRLAPDERRLLLLTNPIDQQGFCSTAEKIALVCRFVGRLEEPLRRGDFRLLVKVHAGEDENLYRTALPERCAGAGIRFVGDCPLYPLLARCHAAVVMASTAGLEALRLGLHLGVLELPGVGFVHDYVSAGAAAGLADRSDCWRDVVELVEGRAGSPVAVAAYLAHNLTAQRNASRQVSELVLSLLGCLDG